MKNGTPVKLTEAHCLLSGAISFLEEIRKRWQAIKDGECGSLIASSIDFAQFDEILFHNEPDDIATLIEHIRVELKAAGFFADPPKQSEITTPSTDRLKRIANDIMKRRPGRG